MKQKWIDGEREVYVLKMREVIDYVTAALVMGGHEEVQNSFGNCLPLPET